MHPLTAALARAAEAVHRAHNAQPSDYALAPPTQELTPMIDTDHAEQPGPPPTDADRLATLETAIRRVREAITTDTPSWIRGHCPACGSAGVLFVGDGGHITCSLDACPDPDAASSLLERRKDRADCSDAAPETEPNNTGLDSLRQEIYTRLNREAEFVGCPSATADDIVRLVRAWREPSVDSTDAAPGGNAEDCPRCAGTDLPYPFICPGHDAPDDWRAQYAAAIECTLLPAVASRERRRTMAEQCATAVAHVRDRELEQLHAEMRRLSGLLGERDAELERLRGQHAAAGDYYQRAKRARAALAALRSRLEGERDKTRHNAERARHDEPRIANDGMSAGLDIALRHLDAVVADTGDGHA